jgi:hypothetical protein
MTAEIENHVLVILMRVIGAGCENKELVSYTTSH